MINPFSFLTLGLLNGDVRPEKGKAKDIISTLDWPPCMYVFIIRQHQGGMCFLIDNPSLCCEKIDEEGIDPEI